MKIRNFFGSKGAGRGTVASIMYEMETLDSTE